MLTKSSQHLVSCVIPFTKYHCSLFLVVLNCPTYIRAIQTLIFPSWAPTSSFGHLCLLNFQLHVFVSQRVHPCIKKMPSCEQSNAPLRLYWCDSDTLSENTCWIGENDSLFVMPLFRLKLCECCRLWYLLSNGQAALVVELASGVSECVDNLPNVKDGVTTAHWSGVASLGSSHT